MRRTHLERFAPVCPRCRAGSGALHPLVSGPVFRGDDDDVREGLLHCTAADCRQEYPILDGFPVLLPNVRAWVVDNLDHLTARDDLSPEIESLLGDCAGPGTRLDARRQHLANYTFDHYGEFDPEALAALGPAAPRPGSVVRTLSRGLELLGEICGPVLDLGCAVGRGTFELASRSDDLVLGVDLHAPMLRMAAGILRTGRVVAPLRRGGVVFERRDHAVSFVGAERVDFWVADALSLPFADATFGTIVAQNVLDCVASPLRLLAVLGEQLRRGGGAVLVTPYDWSPGATPYEAWIGGHSQRGPGGGGSEALLRELISGAHPAAPSGLRMVGEDPDVPWHVRLHDRAVMQYRTHVVALRRA